jgi:small subunit ribosomal protein S16
MAVAIRLSRLGRLHRPFYRVVVIDERSQREGKAIEILGTYDPLPGDKNLQVEIEKLHAWVLRGAMVSASLKALLKHNGYAPAPTAAKATADKAAAKKRKAAKTRKKQDGKTWQAPNRRNRLRHAAGIKAERVAKLTEQQAARAKAKAEAAAAAATATPAPAAGG